MRQTDVVLFLFGSVVVGFLVLATISLSSHGDPIAKLNERESAAYYEFAGTPIPEPRSSGLITLEHYSQDQNGRLINYWSTFVLGDESMVFYRGGDIGGSEYIIFCYTAHCSKANLAENKGRVYLDSRIIIIFSEEDFDPETKSGGEPRVIWYNR